MSLLDALLLEPYRVNIWVAARTDGIAGSDASVSKRDELRTRIEDSLLMGL